MAQHLLRQVAELVDGVEHLLRRRTAAGVSCRVDDFVAGVLHQPRPRRPRRRRHRLRNAACLADARAACWRGPRGLLAPLPPPPPRRPLRLLLAICLSAIALAVLRHRSACCATEAIALAHALTATTLVPRLGAAVRFARARGSHSLCDRLGRDSCRQRRRHRCLQLRCNYLHRWWRRRVRCCCGLSCRRRARRVRRGLRRRPWQCSILARRPGQRRGCIRRARQWRRWWHSWQLRQRRSLCLLCYALRLLVSLACSFLKSQRGRCIWTVAPVIVSSHGSTSIASWQARSWAASKSGPALSSDCPRLS